MQAHTASLGSPPHRIATSPRPLLPRAATIYLALSVAFLGSCVVDAFTLPPAPLSLGSKNSQGAPSRVRWGVRFPQRFPERLGAENDSLHCVACGHRGFFFFFFFTLVTGPIRSLIRKRIVWSWRSVLAPGCAATATLEATQGQFDGFFSQLPYKCHQNRVASVGE